MVLINDIGDLEDIKSVMRATALQPPAWNIRPELRNRIINAFALEKSHRSAMAGMLVQEHDDIVRNMLARIVSEEQVHQDMFGSLLRSDILPWQQIIGAELAFISWATTLAQIEPDPDAAAIFRYILLDHLDQAHTITNKAEALGIDPSIVDEVRDLPGGRPLEQQFHPTQDLIKEPYEEGADPGTKVNIRLMISTHSMTKELVESLGIIGSPEPLAQLGRLLGVVENEHQMMLQTLMNPDESPLEQAFLYELTEVMGLNRLLEVEKETSAREAYNFVVDEDENHLRYLGSMLTDVEGKDPREISSSAIFNAKNRRTQKKYLKEISENDIDCRPSGRSVVRVA